MRARPVKGAFPCRHVAVSTTALLFRFSQKGGTSPAKLFDFARAYGGDEDRERYHVHLTTGPHVSAHLPQPGPPGSGSDHAKLDIIDLDLS